MYIFYLDFVRVYNEDTLNFARDFGVLKDRNFTEIFWNFRDRLDMLKRMNLSSV